MNTKIRYILGTLVATCTLLVATLPATAAPPEYSVTGEACRNHSYYFMGWAEVSADCLTITASTLTEDKGRAELVGWTRYSGAELRQTLMLDCLVVERHSEVGEYKIFASGTNDSGTRYSLTIDSAALAGYWAGAPTGSAPCNSYDTTGPANQEGGAFAVTALSPDVNQRPTASFTHSCDAYKCTFDASMSFDPDGEILEYRWRVGDYYWDYDHYNGKVVTHDFRNCSCPSTIYLTVVDEDGGAGNYSEKVTASTSLDASFVYQCDGLTCSFDASGSTDSNGTIQRYEWTFGDGTSQTTTSPSTRHTYPSPGGYYTYLTITDNDGITDSAVKWITVDVAYELTAQSHHQGQRTKIMLKWSGSAAEQVYIYRDGSNVATVSSSPGRGRSTSLA